MRRILVAIGLSVTVAACSRAAVEPGASPRSAAGVASSAKAPQPPGSPKASDEEADVTARSENADAVLAAVREYASGHGDEYGGMYIDHEPGASLVTLWTGHLADHEQAIRARVSPGARVTFRGVRYSERYLRNLQDQVEADLEWMADIPARWQSVSDDVIHNTVLLTISSANPSAVALIEDHFGLGEALTVVSDGTGVALVPWGEISGRVRTSTGGLPRPDAGYYLRWRSSDMRNCGVLDMGYGLAEDGTFALPCQAGVWTIEVTVPSGDGWRPIGEGTVDVPANDSVKLNIRLTEMP